MSVVNEGDKEKESIYMDADKSDDAGGETSRNFNLYRTNLSQQDILAIVSNDLYEEVVIFIEANSGGIPRIHPRKLKNNIQQVIPDHKEIQTLRFTKQGKLIVVTRACSTASQLLNIETVGTTEVTPRLQRENLSTKFLLRDIPTDISCSEIAEELAENGIYCWEIRRFIRKYQGTESPTNTVLVTKIGTDLPKEITLWYQLHRISVFVDRPRQCLRCWEYTHATKNCGKNQCCKNCGDSHEGECQVNSPVCSQCQGPHPADDKKCGRYIEEQEILKFKSENHVSISEARRRVRRQKYEGEKGKYALSVLKSGEEEKNRSELVTKADLQAVLKEFTITIGSLVQTALENQMLICQQMVTQTTSAIISAMQQAKVPCHQSLDHEKEKSPTRKSKVPRINNPETNQKASSSKVDKLIINSLGAQKSPNVSKMDTSEKSPTTFPSSSRS